MIPTLGFPRSSPYGYQMPAHTAPTGSDGKNGSALQQDRGEDKVTLSGQLNRLNSEQQTKENQLAQEHELKIKRLDQEFEKEQSQIEQEYSRKKSRLQISLYA